MTTRETSSNGVIGLALGDHHSVIMKRDGSVWSTYIAHLERYSSYESVCASRANKHVFTRVISVGVTAVAAGTDFSMVLKQDGSVWSAGCNRYGQLGNGSKNPAFDFQQVVTGAQTIMTGAKAIAAGSLHSMVVTKEGHVWTSGWNKYGQLGDGINQHRTRFFVTMSSGVKAVAVAAGEHHSVVLKEDGSVWAAGRNNYGQLGDGSKDDRNSFVEVVSGGAVVVAAGGYHSMVVKDDGSVWATGWNEYGQLGDGSTIDRVNFVPIALGVVKIAVGGRLHSMMLKQDGSVWATGYNDYGQLGNGWAADIKDFVQVISGGAQEIAAGAFHSMVLKQDGSIWGTGSNSDGQFGDGSTTSQTNFVRLALFGEGSRHDCLCMHPL